MHTPLSNLQPNFSFRPAITKDGPSIIAIFDACLPYLSTIGSIEQWGLVPFSQREGWLEETMKQLADAEHYHLTGESEEGSVNERLRLFVVEVGSEVETKPEAETKVDGDVRGFDSVNTGSGSQLAGIVFVRAEWVPSYITSQSHISISDTERVSSIYLEVMVSDPLIGKGAGKALIEGVCEFGRSLGKTVLYVDGWVGNEKKLIRGKLSGFGRYYEKQGFQLIADFSLPRKGKVPWLGALMKMNI
ncbi:uncharacterized protein RCO7_02332 [Rhynchosporium graminicola]|uniref:N-acetyltransferase domain-containing protein n=1 Tax=Rhynchosporium graminicola TaxID=2792576 RepID=A0A1E1K0C9_9HELO|nr:uncharacterized protein RCO7_02332 [Rhynchosporium commune]